MQPYDACRLVAVNLFSFVEKPFTKEAKFNFDKFYEYNYEAMVLSDVLIDLELEHIDRILNKIENDPEPHEAKRTEKELWQKVRETAMSSRRAGLGITALADTVAALGIKYDSEKSLKIIEKIGSKKLESELDCSIDLSITRGSFKGWDISKEFDENLKGKNSYFEMLADKFPVQAKRMQKYGRRNVSFSTVAPTGSVSILTQTTSGIEPLFQPYYMRRKKVNANEKGVRVDFIDQSGDAWQEFPVLHPKFKEWCEWKTFTVFEEDGTPSEDELQYLFEQSPWYGATANDIDWLKRVAVQSTLQQTISHSISATINLPEEVSQKEVSDIYLESWSKGLKGVTVYRDGSRSGVLVSSDKKDEGSLTDNNAPKRPKEIKSEIVRFQNNLEKWIAVVGLVGGRPYEIFTGKLESFSMIPNSVSEGVTVKNRDENGSRYDFKYKDKNGDFVTVEGLSVSFDKEYWNYARMISGVLRHGMPLPYVVELVKSLNLEEDTLNTWKNGVSRVIKRFIPDGTKGADVCENCGEKALVFKEGCLTCSSCGDSRCG